MVNGVICMKATPLGVSQAPRDLERGSALSLDDSSASVRFCGRRGLRNSTGLARHAQTVLSRLSEPLGLVAGSVYAADRAGAPRHRPELLAFHSTTQHLDLHGLGRQMLQIAPPTTETVVAEIAAWPAAEWLYPLLSSGGRWLISTPITVDGQPSGVMLVVRSDEPGDVARSALDLAAGQIALTIQHSRQEQEIRDRLTQAERRIAELEASGRRKTRIDRELVQRNRELMALSDIARSLNQAVGLEEVLRRAVDRVTDVMHVEAAMVRLVEGDELVVVAHRGLSAKFIAAAQRMPIDDSASGLAFQRGQPQVIEDCTTDDRMAHATAAEEGLVSLVLLPMLVKGKAVGVLNALSRRPRRFTEAEVRLLNTLAAEIGIAVENARLYEAELSRLAGLEELDRLKTDFVLTISHELRTPLAIVKASLDALSRKWDSIDESRRRSYVTVGKQGSSRLQRLLEDLLLVSRIETTGFAPRLESVELAPLLHEAVDEALAERPDRRVEVLVPADLPPVQADRAALSEILSNLLDNAAKYSPTDSTITLAGEASGDEVRVRVVDSGIGIAPNMHRLFRRFERIDSSVPSSRAPAWASTSAGNWSKEWAGGSGPRARHAAARRSPSRYERRSTGGCQARDLTASSAARPQARRDQSSPEGTAVERRQATTRAQRSSP